ncbi:energy transducer TonB [Sulfitobacter aestuariivivens]|uniref:Energy transducer TonB n=1 Tax=Sulfitobacter aestuariivivens TaxID=2766981 RepID=A0A927HG38_9RHOB|nr:energy transducer TonB [Sulfitobacter aestuariivivens]MBD3663865.1 energy transducer TonB [Sulfitobacter aestuariivivens]
MDTGQYISGAGHLILIGWAFLGGVFRSEPPPFEMTEVSVITGAEFDAILAAQVPPDQVTDVAQPQAPEITPDAPEVAAEPDRVIDQPVPSQAEAPPEDSPPEEVPDAPPQPAEVTDAAPTLDDPVGDVAVLAPEVAPEAAPRPIERVAPEPVAQPDPEAAPELDQQQAVAPDEAGETPDEPQDATAPEEATTEIVTEATAAPAASVRPPGRRPAAPEPQVATNEASQDDNAAAIAAAVAAAQAAAEAPGTPAPSGPPLTQGERESLRLAVKECWNVGSMSSEALRTIVVVGVQMNRDGTPIGNTIRLLSSTGGSDAAARQGFETARRAILRCGGKGFDLPDEKYGQWQSIEITFDPRKMQ